MVALKHTALQYTIDINEPAFQSNYAEATALLQLRNGLTLAGNPTIAPTCLPSEWMRDSLRIRKGILLHIMKKVWKIR